MDCFPVILADAATTGGEGTGNSVLMLVLALVLVVLNGFFVAAEFAMVKVRLGQVKKLVEQGKPFAKTAYWLAERLDQSLSACQLGITMASLALGWVGEPAFATLVEPVFHKLGVQSEQLLHTFSFIVAFSCITALHLVVGEQAPKIFAIRRPKADDTLVCWADVILLLLAVPVSDCVELGDFGYPWLAWT